MPLGVELPPNVQKLVAAEHRRALEAFGATHPIHAGNLHVLQGLPHECLKSAAEDQHADFVVMGAVARRGIKKLLIGSTAERVLDRLPCDLIVIKPARVVVPGQA
jgi:universal stress protein E